MGSYLQIVETDQTTETTNQDFGSVAPGKTNEMMLGVYNDTSNSIADVQLEIWPTMKDNQYSGDSIFSSARVIKQNVAEEFQVTEVAKEDDDAVCVAASSVTERPVIYEYDGATFSQMPTVDDLVIPASVNYTYYIGLDHIVSTLGVELSDVASIDLMTVQIVSSDNSTFYEHAAVDDGTLKLAQDGSIFAGSVDYENFGKKSIEGEYKHWMELSFGGTVFTAATVSALYWETYQLPNEVLQGKPGSSDFYRKQSGATFVACAEPDYKYSKMGLFSYYSTPVLPTENLAISHSYMLPQPDKYTFEFQDATTVRKTIQSSGATVDYTVLCNGSRKYYEILPGMELVFSSICESGQIATIDISDSAKYIFLATNDAGQPYLYENNDINVGAIAAATANPFHLEHKIPFSVDVSENERYFEFYGYGTV